jgi:hypothetical protein
MISFKDVFERDNLLEREVVGTKNSSSSFVSSIRVFCWANKASKASWSFFNCSSFFCFSISIFSHAKDFPVVVGGLKDSDDICLVRSSVGVVNGGICLVMSSVGENFGGVFLAMSSVGVDIGDICLVMTSSGDISFVMSSVDADIDAVSLVMSSVVMDIDDIDDTDVMSSVGVDIDDICLVMYSVVVGIDDIVVSDTDVAGVSGGNTSFSSSKSLTSGRSLFTTILECIVDPSKNLTSSSSGFSMLTWETDSGFVFDSCCCSSSFCCSFIISLTSFSSCELCTTVGFNALAVSSTVVNNAVGVDFGEVDVFNVIEDSVVEGVGDVGSGVVAVDSLESLDCDLNLALLIASLRL